ncbi:MAG TPA: hypothetical protein VK166_01600 [Chitinophagaceae bacterium]|nr:hypothetical protein [Chitinophagaceae bacterium]
MKRLTAILLALIYISTTSGIVVSAHYCMGEISDIAIGSSNNATCGTCGMENNGCCHDDLQVIKLTENHNIAAIHFELPVPESPTQHLDIIRHTSVIDQPHFGNSQNHSPPFPVSRNVLYCIYRI